MPSTPSLNNGPAADNASNAPPSLAGLNPRSCTVCRRRKVKCDKKMPCGNCVKAGNDCVFPASRGVPQPSNSSYSQSNGRDAQLLARLNKLEKVVKELRRHPDVEEGLPKQFAWNTKTGGRETSPSEFMLRTDVGRLQISDDGQSRYSSSRLWTTLCDEAGVENIREIIDETVDVNTPPDSTNDSDISVDTDRGAFLFGCTCKTQDMLDLHPLPSQIMFYWKIYVENVDPIVTVLHKPSVAILLNSVKDRLDTIDRGTEVLLFSIYFAVVTSMTSEEVETELKQSRSTLLRRYKYGVEKALARADFLNTHELVILQAFIIFLFCARCHDRSRFTWTLTSVAIRLAHSLGIHRDGTKFGLSPFDIEMRRRVWWNVRLLHDRASQDYGSSHCSMYDSDALLPLNINDEDISPASTQAPPSRMGFTEATFFLIRLERIVAQDNLAAYNDGCLKGITAKNEKIIRDYEDNCKAKYVGHIPDPKGVPLLCAYISRLGASKMWINHYQHLRGVCNLEILLEDRAEHMFQESMQILEDSVALYNEPTLKKWSWLFKTYTNANLVINLHAFVCVANKFCADPTHVDAERAYHSIEVMYEYWAMKLHIERRREIWLPIGKLMKKAQNVRAGLSPATSGSAAVASWSVIDHPSGETDSIGASEVVVNPPSGNSHSMSVASGEVINASDLRGPSDMSSGWDDLAVPPNIDMGSLQDRWMDGAEMVGFDGAQDLNLFVVDDIVANDNWPAWMTFGDDWMNVAQPPI